MRQLHLSARGYHRVLKVGRTIADLEGADLIEPPHSRGTPVPQARRRLEIRRKDLAEARACKEIGMVSPDFDEDRVHVTGSNY